MLRKLASDMEMECRAFQKLHFNQNLQDILFVYQLTNATVMRESSSKEQMFKPPSQLRLSFVNNELSDSIEGELYHTLDSTLDD